MKMQSRCKKDSCANKSFCLYHQSKPKPSKFKKIQAWADMSADGSILGAIRFYKKSCYNKTIPCHILIDKKYLGRKG